MANLLDIFPGGFGMNDDDDGIDVESTEEAHDTAEEPPEHDDGMNVSEIPEPEIKAPPPRSLTFQSVKDLLENPPLVRWLVHGLIESETLTLLFGPSGAGKSFVALDLAASIACGYEWHGHQVKPGPVVYILGEGAAGVSRRMKAWDLTHPEANLREAPLYISNRIVPLGESEAIAEIDVAIQESEIGIPAVVFIDTLARAAVGMDENSSKDMGELLYVCDQIRYKYKCVVILIHHTGHVQGRSRGSTAIKGNLDVELSLTSKDGIISLETPKVKEDKELNPFTFQLERVDTGWLDEDGEPVYSAVIKSCDAEEKPHRVKPLTESQRLGVSSYCLAAESGRGHCDVYGKFNGVHLEEWRPFYYKLCTSDSIGSKQRSFLRSRDALVNEGLATVSNDIYRITEQSTYIRETQFNEAIKR